MSYETSIERIIKRDRLIIIFSLIGIVLLAWMYLFYLYLSMKNINLRLAVSMPQTKYWSSVDFVFVFLMWGVMMVAMMVPSAAPMVIMFSTISRKRREQEAPFVSTGIFLSGYLVAWAFYSALATLGQWLLHTASLLSPMMMMISNPILTGILLLIVGIFQFTPIKYVCLTHCQSPFEFILNKWKEGRRGAFIMGISNGNYCVTCCWALMSLLFVVGIMNIIWIAIIAVFILAEKLVITNRQISRLSGIFIILWGIGILAGALN